MSLPGLIGRLNPLRWLRPDTVTSSALDWDLVRRIRGRTEALRQSSDEELQKATAQLRCRVRDGGVSIDSDEIQVAGFALINESARRSLGIEFYDVQLLAARFLTRGMIAEMATGEGKTFVQSLAAFVFALQGRGVHVMTSNAYLAERDHQLLAALLQRLGLTVGLLQSDASPAEKKRAYRADITYGAGYEFGFDYLRDQVALQQQQKNRPALGEAFQRMIQDRTADEVEPMQREHACAIVDEIDSVLIDEATTPLILSAGARKMTQGTAAYEHAARVVEELRVGSDFELDRQRQRVQLTPQGLRNTLTPQILAEDLQIERPWPIYLEQALHARYLLQRDVDYVVDADQIKLVDQTTGRIFDDRSLRGGLHQAVEAKERVRLTAPRNTLARISRQQFMQLYDCVCGMTGTARDSSREFKSIYRLRIATIPTRLACQRLVLSVRFFVDQRAKRAAIVHELQRRFERGQPTLVGTRTIRESRELGALLNSTSVPYRLLNGTQDAREADIIAQAGITGAVTLATNMAGRGTDIQLGEGVPERGGLHVIASEPHASTRVDRQLIGRSARQGDPGSCQLFVSAEDDLIRLHAPRLAGRMRRLGDSRGEIALDLSDEILRIQRRVERSLAKRRQMLARDRWLEEVMAKLAGRQQ